MNPSKAWDGRNMASVAGSVGKTLARTKAFSDRNGNRFVYPSMICWPQDDEWDRPSPADLIIRAMGLDLALGTKADKGWFDFDPENFPHARMEMGHRRFAHGRATVLVFAGPVFEAAALENSEAQ